MTLYRSPYSSYLFATVLYAQIFSHAVLSGSLLSSETEENGSRNLFLKKFRKKRAAKALTSLYESTGGEGWSSSSGWLSEESFCAWDGVTCSGSDVTGLNLSGFGLSGPIPIDDILKFSRLESLDLSENSLSSTIPYKLYRLLGLKELNLSGNALTSTIPAKIGFLLGLKKLDLSNNQLTGSIPSALGVLINLEELELQLNDGLSGGMASEVCRLHASWSLGNITESSGESVEEIVSFLLDTFADSLPEFLDFLPDLLGDNPAFVKILQMLPSADLKIVSADCNIGTISCACCADGFQPCCYNANGEKECIESRASEFLKQFTM